MKQLLTIINCKEIWYCSDNCGRVLVIDNNRTFTYHEHSFVPDIEQFHVIINKSKSQLSQISA